MNENAEAGRVLALLEEGNKVFVPGLWHLEARNSLIVEMRRKKLAAGWYRRIVGSLGKLPVQTDHHPDLDTAFELAAKHRLTFYDAVYLELAKRRSASIATFDKAMVRAAVAERISLVSKKFS